MSEDQLRDKVLLRISQHVASGKPVILGSYSPRQIGDIDNYWHYPPESTQILVQKVRVVRESSYEEYLRVMPPGLDGNPTLANPNAYYYEVESD